MNALIRNLTPRQLVVIGLIVPLLCTVLIGWLQWQVVRQLLEGRIIGRNIRSVQVDLGIFRYSLSDAESDQFRYILTQNPHDLDQYSKHMDKVIDRFRDLRQLTITVPVQQQYLDQIEPLLSAKEQSADQSFNLEKSGNHAGALQVISSDAGRQNMSEIESAVENMQIVAAQQVLQRQFISAHNLKVTAFVSVAGLIINVACIAAVLLLIRRLQRLQSNVTLDALKEMINYEDGKLTIEEYLSRRATALSTHGKAQIEAERLIGQLERRKARSATARVTPVQAPPP